MTLIDQTHTHPPTLDPPNDAPPHTAVATFNAWFFDHFGSYINFATRHHKRAAFADIPNGTVLEIGAGTGANFAHLPTDIELIALEPSHAMHHRLRANATAADRDVVILDSGAESIDLPDESVDTVVASLVLCTVANPDAVLAEIHRVLRPGGTFRFVEHVAAPRLSPRRALQRIVATPWAWLFEGCDSCRSTHAHLQRSPFAHVEVRRRRFAQSLFVVVNSAIWGIATKSHQPSHPQ